ncbi:MAG: DUF4154 domain-containing protein [Alphaproteobacteria bacterium]|nr:DUF4154 domain-containing protein [Alphaproteobacteria bacterium]
MRHTARILLIGAFGAMLAAWAHADENVQLIEQKIKAGLIYNFLKYTQWPLGSRQITGPIVVCMLGGDAFDGNLQPIAGRTVNERAIELHEVASAAEAAPCALLVVNSARQSDWPQLKTALANQSIMTVSDFDGFATQGGMIEFTHEDNRVGVTINADAVATAHLVVQDRLLKLASAVRSGGSGP